MLFTHQNDNEAEQETSMLCQSYVLQILVKLTKMTTSMFSLASYNRPYFSEGGGHYNATEIV